MTPKNEPAWYRSRIFKVVAVKWDGTEETYATVRNFAGPALLAKQIYGGGLIISTDSGDALVRVGDYIVRDLDGTFTCITAQLFERTYDAV